MNQRGIRLNFSAKSSNCGDRDLIWVFMKLAVEVWMVVRIHAALENLSIHGSVKKACRDPKGAYVITASPSFANFAAL